MKTKRLQPSFGPAPNRWFTTRSDGSDSDGGDDDGNGGSGDGDGGGGSTQTIDVEEIIKKAVEEASKAATEAANSTADKRINQILDRIDKGSGGSDGDDGDGNDDGGQASQSIFTEREKRMQRRLLAAALRDEVKRLPDNIQSHALKLAKAVTDRMEFDDGTDEDEVAVEVINQVEEQLEDVKTTFETGLRDDLKSRGLLKDDDGDGGQGPKDDDGDGSGDGDDALAQFEEGANRAKEMFEPKE